MDANNDVLLTINNKKEIDKMKVGYSTSDYKWFSTSIPDKMYLECNMCDCMVHVERNDVLEGKTIPQFCPSCQRKSLKIHDKEKWDKYFELQLWEFELFLDQYKTGYAIYNNGSRHVLPIKSSHMERILSLRCKNPNQIKTSEVYMDGLAGASRQVKYMSNRITKNEQGIWVDCATTTGEAILINEDEWKIVDTPPVLFRRFDHQLPLIVEIGTKKDFDEYMALMNFSSETDKLLYAGYAATLFMPEIDHPILMPIGPQGSAKTTISLATKLLIDPSKTPLLTVPDEADKLPLMFHFNYFPIFDNCNYLSQEASDMFCRACTGGGISARKLYTDMEEVTYSFHAPIVLNGVSAPSMSPDLIDRSLQINLDRIFEQNRKEKAVIEAKRDALLPRVRGYLIGIVSDAMRNGPTPSPFLPRLADFARQADACAYAMGYKQGEYMEAYLKLSRDAAKEAARSDIVMEALFEYLEVNNMWEGSASELFKVLISLAGTNAKSPNWPKDTIRFSDSLFGKFKPSLMIEGWNIERIRSNGRRIIKIWKNNDTSSTLFQQQL